MDILKENWDSKWRERRDLTALVITMLLASVPALFFFSMTTVDFLNSPVTLWFTPTPAGESAVFDQNFGQIVFSVLWTGIIISLYWPAYVEYARN